MIPGLALTVVLAEEPPRLLPYPSAPAPVPGECLEALGLEVGALVPEVLAGADLRVRCAAVALPVSQQLDLLGIEAWSGACRDQYAVVVQADAQTIAALTIDRDRWRDLATSREAEVEKARRWYRQPVVSMAIGGLAVGVAVGGGAYLVAAL